MRRETTNNGSSDMDTQDIINVIKSEQLRRDWQTVSEMPEGTSDTDDFSDVDYLESLYEEAGN